MAELYLKQREHLPSAFKATLKTYGFVWLANFIFSLAAMVISSGLFSVPWYSVVNVTLSLILFTAGVVLMIYGAIALFNLVTLRIPNFLTALISGAMYALLPFASVVAYSVYALLGGVADGGDAFVMDGFMGFVRGLLTAAERVLPGLAIGSPEQWLVRLSGVIALIALIMTAYDARKRRRVA